MKMIRAVVRPSKAEEVVDALAESGCVALTKMDVIGRGKQKGIKIDQIYYDELPKTMLMIVVEDDAAECVVETVTKTAYTGNFGDGKIFVSPVDEAYTVRTRSCGL
ncbi:nitrogen regulatory protein PII 1 [Methanococcus maripaludis]|uniref:Nitrogen regulatory protein PII 1 n=1 Tax=Methanococcus maripaludis TaxID=39152 RepID=A0A7J9NIN1_METMI|nr:P-II family nitrogen regulator [Methanococcus maripaludis]MBA2840370.1 nitrogen regulatory protein PII 1 [Methanococcus maripaludis]MBA2853911.1 nitrogen regulatory protein PII 1 [Methanococcus maripaludis]MBA2860083.1 nitrogen regulatory protein PII 1 [Methanococcus maripaludis]MBA2868725.1 nitrogen regulatory protein PII 1 [Methanococcus maripaludis]MBB6402586.1 nitrogen regulatory protein PII 1 [Methanococcus maripaludis]